MEKACEKAQQANELVVLWASGEREVALKMVFMYTFGGGKTSV